MTQCACTTKIGKRCSRNAKSGSKYCYQHQKCTKPFKVTKINAKAKAKAQKKQQAAQQKGQQAAAPRSMSKDEFLRGIADLDCKMGSNETEFLATEDWVDCQESWEDCKYSDLEDIIHDDDDVCMHPNGAISYYQSALNDDNIPLGLMLRKPWSEKVINNVKRVAQKRGVAIRGRVKIEGEIIFVPTFDHPGLGRILVVKENNVPITAFDNHENLSQENVLLRAGTIPMYGDGIIESTSHQYLAVVEKLKKLYSLGKIDIDWLRQNINVMGRFSAVAGRNIYDWDGDTNVFSLKKRQKHIADYHSLTTREEQYEMPPGETQQIYGSFVKREDFNVRGNEFVLEVADELFNPTVVTAGSTYQAVFELLNTRLTEILPNYGFEPPSYRTKYLALVEKIESLG